MKKFRKKNSLNRKMFFYIVIVYVVLCVSPIMASAQIDTIQGPIPIPMAPSAMAGVSPMPMPGMTGPLKANPKPIGYNTGLLATMYITGVVSGIGQWQDNVFPGDRHYQSDVSNGQIFIQKIDGVVQYFLQIGGYSLPDIGVPYFRSGTAVKSFYGMFPQGFLKIAPTKNFSIQAGKLPTLIGAEYTFSFENMNTQRGLLWNQENAVNRGVQANYTEDRSPSLCHGMMAFIPISIVGPGFLLHMLSTAQTVLLSSVAAVPSIRIFLRRLHRYTRTINRFMA